MALSKKNWTLNSYTIDTWTDLVAETATVATIVVTNPTAGAISVQFRLDDGAGTSLFQLLPTFSIDANGSKTFDLRSFVITGSQRLQIQADVVGAEFYAGGAIDV